MLQVYTGTGKGKTTAALGVALRASGYGMKTLMLSFLKDDPEYGEARAAKNLPWFTLRQVGRDAFVNFHNPDPVDSHIKGDCDYARSTAPERKHPVHTGIFFVPPLTLTLTDLMFGFHILLLLLCEWLTLIPK